MGISCLYLPGHEHPNGGWHNNHTDHCVSVGFGKRLPSTCQLRQGNRLVSDGVFRFHFCCSLGMHAGVPLPCRCKERHQAKETTKEGNRNQNHWFLLRKGKIKKKREREGGRERSNEKATETQRKEIDKAVNQLCSLLTYIIFFTENKIHL